MAEIRQYDPKAGASHIYRGDMREWTLTEFPGVTLGVFILRGDIDSEYRDRKRAGDLIERHAAAIGRAIAQRDWLRVERVLRGFFFSITVNGTLAHANF